MSHKKVGKEESERRARANLKDFHWWVIIHIFIIIGYENGFLRMKVDLFVSHGPGL